MKRRGFLKLSLVAGAVLFTPVKGYSKTLNLSEVNFSTAIYNANAAQSIIIFLYGGPSQLAGNLSNIEEIKSKSQSDYDNYFRGITKTSHECWQEAGGAHMEAMMSSGDMTIFRSCFSQVREDEGNKAHGVCTQQNQKGSFDEESAGIITNLAQILEYNGVIDEQTIMPFVTMDGESIFYTQGNNPLSAYLRPVGINKDLDNPYARSAMRDWRYYTKEERDDHPDNYRDYDALLHGKMDTLAQENNQGKIRDAFDKRANLDAFIEEIKTVATPDLKEDAYPTNNRFAENLESAIKILSHNADTKVVTIGAGGLGGWDDHNDARDYISRSESLFRSLRSAIAHLKEINKIDEVNIMVFGEFGRNVNLNAAQGWDHGNLQNFYLLGGKGYFTHRDVVGETVVSDTGAINRLYLKPKTTNDAFEPLSIAATLYKIYGITNPEVLTDGNAPVDI
jgi:hypothetical protein